MLNIFRILFLEHCYKERKYYLNSLEPDGWFVSYPNPRRILGHTQTSSHQVYAELSLRAVGGAVAVPGLTIRHNLTMQLS
jgi:hypothetical protein